MQGPTIDSQVVSGSGVEVVHSYLAQNLSNYNLTTIDPKLGALPCLVPSYKGNSEIVHTTAELGTRGFTSEGKNLVSVHNYYYDDEYINKVPDPKRRLYYKLVGRKANRKSCQQANHIVTVSHYLAKLIKQEISPKAEISVIHNGIDTERFSPKTKNHNKPTVLFAGNPIARKGFNIFESIAAELCHKADFWATGGLQGHKHKHNKNIKFFPKVAYSEMPSIFQRSDILLFPSHREGFGLVVAEAMACGLAVVCSKNSALPELVEHDRGGFLIGAQDTQQWIKAVDTLIENRELSQEFGVYNRKKSLEKFGLEKMLKQYQELFLHLRG